METPLNDTMIKIEYDVYHFYTDSIDGVYGEPWKHVTIDESTTIGRQIIRALIESGKLYIGAVYTGCKITSIIQ